LGNIIIGERKVATVRLPKVKVRYSLVPYENQRRERERGREGGLP
jgi:hypothetical protein